MQFPRDDLRAICSWAGYLMANQWDDFRLGKKVSLLHTQICEDEHILEDARLDKVLQEVLAAGRRGEEITVGTPEYQVTTDEAEEVKSEVDVVKSEADVIDVEPEVPEPEVEVRKPIPETKPKKPFVKKKKKIIKKSSTQPKRPQYEVQKPMFQTRGPVEERVPREQFGIPDETIEALQEQRMLRASTRAYCNRFTRANATAAILVKYGINVCPDADKVLEADRLYVQNGGRSNPASALWNINTGWRVVCEYIRQLDERRRKHVGS